MTQTRLEQESGKKRSSPQSLFGGGEFDAAGDSPDGAFTSSAEPDAAFDNSGADAFMASSASSAMSMVAGGLGIQAKLEVGAQDDPLEKEADQVAEKVVRMSIGEPPSDLGNSLLQDEKKLVRPRLSASSPLIQRQTASPIPSPAPANTTTNNQPAVWAEPNAYATYEEWLAALQLPSLEQEPRKEKVVTNLMPPDLESLVESLQADCADVSIILRHYYLKNHQQMATILDQYQIGYGVSNEQLRHVVGQVGSIHFRDVNTESGPSTFFKDNGNVVKNLKQLLDMGLSVGDLLIWSQHVQTIQNIDRNGHSITVLQGHSAEKKGRVYAQKFTFQQLTRTDDGDGNIGKYPVAGSSMYFIGASSWRAPN